MSDATDSSSNSDGVPVLDIGNGEFVENITVTATQDGPGVSETTSTVKWGIFDSSGEPVIVGDSCLAFEYVRDSNVSKYPVEQGGFESYNKVQAPRGVKLTFTKGGTISDKATF